ncbi:hypothetical protein [Mucilaginibacter segetis]|uniref:Uncharacterized protein n=1 Tax=Mucilaginibacter segetis TaxID=2793071 RepID=A0A934UMD5_9SPHI|nr:hypothetical protein [Mucilaginibacter segetis]MBK0379284.1 hypothetical protein [Mucilaginibacter segetis]
MKKAMLVLLGFAGCTTGSRTYVNHTEGQYAIADDTLVIQDTILVNRTGYQKIRNGVLQPKEFKVRQWGLHSPDAPVIRFDGKRAFWNNTIYTQLP